MPAGTATQNFPAGTFTIQGDLSIGNGTNNTTVSANANNTTLTVSGSVNINSNSTFTAHTSNSLFVGDDWSNNGTFNANFSTITFNGTDIQTLSGSTTFYGMRALATGTTLQFTNGTTFYVTHMVEFQNIYLRSTSDNLAWHFKYSGSSQTLMNLDVRDSNASLGILMNCLTISTNSGNNTNWDFGPPSAILDLLAAQGIYGTSVLLTWSAPGDDGSFGTLNNSTFTIQYSTLTAFAEGSTWSPTDALPSLVYRVNITTTNVTPGVTQGQLLTGLISGATYYFRAWTQDDVANYSYISNGTTDYATNIVLSILLSTDTLSLPESINMNTTLVISTGIVVTNDGNVDETFEFRATTATVGSPWTIQTSTGIDQFVLWSIINATEPASGDFENLDKLGELNTRCTTTAISNGNGNCVSVPVGESRTIWFKLGMPSATSTIVPQAIRITGEATLPD
jgi:hypothetical protein